MDNFTDRGTKLTKLDTEIKREQVYIFKEQPVSNIPHQILISKADLKLNYQYKTPNQKLAYKGGEPHWEWQNKCRLKLTELLGIDSEPESRKIVKHHTTIVDGGLVHSLLMEVGEDLTIPGYLFIPDRVSVPEPVIAIQGHGDVRGVIGLIDDYHHGFGAELFRAGMIVLIPELRGFGNLYDLAAKSRGRRLEYANWGHHMAYTLVTDAFIKGRTLIGDTIEDLRAWANYVCDLRNINTYMAAGISYGGDLALILAALDERVVKTFASGTMGSMDVIFQNCYNMPAHCIPNILKFMDRKEIASCIAPRNLYIHYGELDKPSPDNYSASFNETVMPAFEEVQKFYAALNAEKNVKLFISENMGHEMDNSLLIKCFQKEK